MREEKLKEVLSKPVMDDEMDQKIANALLLHNTRRRNLFKSGLIQFRFIPKTAIVLLVVVLFGSGTAIAASIFCKSTPTEIEHVTKEELATEKVVSPEIEERKTFGQGNEPMSLFRDAKGNIIVFDENGQYTLEDGTVIDAPFIPNPERHTVDRTNGDEAFAKADKENLIPSALYEDYLLTESGFSYTKARFDDNSIIQTIQGEFFPDYSKSETLSERVYLNYSFDTMDKVRGVLHVVDDVDNGSEDSQSTYETKGGILCTLLENAGHTNVTCHITTRSSADGNCTLTIEFVNFNDKAEIYRILESLPMTVDDAQ